MAVALHFKMMSVLQNRIFTCQFGFKYNFQHYDASISLHCTCSTCLSTPYVLSQMVSVPLTIIQASSLLEHMNNSREYRGDCVFDLWCVLVCHLEEEAEERFYL